MASFGNAIMGFFGGSSTGGGGGISGSGTTNTLSKWASASSLTDSQITDNGTVVAISNWLQFENNSSGYTGYGRIYNFNSLVIGGVTNYSDTVRPYITLGVVGGNNMTNGTTFIQNSIGDVGQTSGTYVNTKVTGRVLSFSGNAEHRFLTITPSYDDNGNTNTYTGTIRGLYYNLTKTTLFPSGASNIAWENVNGDIVFGNFSGSSLPNRVLQMNINGKLAPQNGSFNLYNGSNQDILDATSGGLYRFGNLTGGRSIVVDTINGYINTTDTNGLNGLVVGTGFTNIGQFTGGYVYLGINYGNNEIATYNTASTSDGLSLDFSSKNYRIGGFNGNSNFIGIDDTNNIITFETSNLTFTGASLQSGSSGGNSGQHLVITLNGSPYKIALQIP